MTVFKTSITQSADFIDRLYLGLYKGVHAYPNKYCSYTVYSHFLYPVKRQGWKFDFLDIETSIIV